MAVSQINGASIETGSVLTADLADGAVTNAKLANGYPNQDVVEPVSVNSQTFGGTNVYYNLGSIVIPSAGVWRIFADLRWGGPSGNAFFRTQLSTTTGSAGVFTRSRMQFEQPVANSGNFNISLHSEWFVTFGTGISYPYTVYLGGFQANASTALFLNSDDNGRNILCAQKIASTTSTGSTPVQLGS